MVESTPLIHAAMPIKQSSIKDVRRIGRRTARNLQVKRGLKKLERTLSRALAANELKAAAEAATKLQQALAKAAKRHILHRNAAARQTGQASRAVNALRRK